MKKQIKFEKRTHPGIATGTKPPQVLRPSHLHLLTPPYLAASSKTSQNFSLLANDPLSFRILLERRSTLYDLLGNALEVQLGLGPPPLGLEQV